MVHTALLSVVCEVAFMGLQGDSLNNLSTNIRFSCLKKKTTIEEGCGSISSFASVGMLKSSWEGNCIWYYLLFFQAF